MADRGALDRQQAHWDAVFAAQADRFGASASEPARAAAAYFRAAGLVEVLELGAGQGRDSLFLAGQGFRVCALDYSPAAVAAVCQRAAAAGPAAAVQAADHDVRRPPPFPAGRFDACYSHMLFCMAFTTPQIMRLGAEEGPSPAACGGSPCAGPDPPLSASSELLRPCRRGARAVHYRLRR